MKATGRFHEVEERNNKGFGSSSFANRGDTYGGSSVGLSTIGKESIAKVKGMFRNMILTQRLMKTGLLIRTANARLKNKFKCSSLVVFGPCIWVFFICKGYTASLKFCTITV